ncbi:MAG: glycosyltransferase [Bacteroidales bacterium]|nr:glycosyltransferase [Bacteroidales bacterium]
MKILILVSRIPYPLEKGDKLRAYHHIKHLSRNNEIILCCLNDLKNTKDYTSHLQPFCKKIHIIDLPALSILINLFKAFIKKKPLQIGYFFNKKAKKTIDKIIKLEKPDRIFCQLIRVTEYVKDYNINKTLDYQDVFSTGMKRIEQYSPFYLKWIYKLEAKRLKHYESNIFDYFNKKIIISAPDRNEIHHKNKKDIHIIPNGIDLNFFTKIEASKTFDLVFVGNMSYYPNVVSVLYLAKEILPLVKKQIPNIKLLIAGAKPVKKILKLQSEDITVKGWVDDIRHCYASAKIFIAPMLIGTGLQNKLLEAMAMQLPCITSPLANDALKAINNKEIIVCNNSDAYANAITELINNPDKAHEIALNGNKFVSANYNWDILNTQLENIILL